MMIEDPRKVNAIYFRKKKWVRLLAFLSFDQNKMSTLNYFRLIVTYRLVL